MSTCQDGTDCRPQVLIAEDDQDFMEALVLWLSEYDHPEVTTVMNGAEAVEALDPTVDVFLCDQRMPGLTGPEVIERLEQADYDVPTIVISAYEPDYPEDSNVDLYLSKPIDREELFDAIDRILES